MKHGNKVLAKEILTQVIRKRPLWSKIFAVGFVSEEWPVSLSFQTLESIKRKQVEKYHKAPQAEKETIECNPYAIFHQGLENCKPIVGLASIQKGGKSYQVGKEVESPIIHQSINMNIWSFTVPLRCPSLFRRTDVASSPWNGWSQSAGRTDTDGHTCTRNSRRSYWQRPPRRATLSRRSLSCTRWPKPTGPTLTTAGGSWTASGTEMWSFQCFLTFTDCMDAVLAS